jgi:peptidyl-prolyl cis-trans isomerase A (cyclophilin A)
LTVEAKAIFLDHFHVAMVGDFAMKTATARTSSCGIIIGLVLSLAATPAFAKKDKSKTAVIETSMGNITVKLFPDRAPKAVDNFIGLASGKKAWTDPKAGKEVKGKPLYNGTLFHRVIPDFMIQGGDPLGNGTGGPGYNFADEVHPDDAFDKPGILAMANAGPGPSGTGTNGSQFFITVKPTPWLNGRHTIFGEVTKGMDIVEKISKVQRGPNDMPETPVTIKKIKIM